MPVPPIQKELVWIKSAKDELKAMPRGIQKAMGFALDAAQRGLKHRSAKPLRGYSGAKVFEIVDEHDTDTFRTLYTVEFEDGIYVLCAFKKKSKTGSELPQELKVRVAARYAAARVKHAERVAERKHRATNEQ